MDLMVKKNIEKFLSNVSLFYSLLKDKIDKKEEVDEIVNLLEMQHSLNKGLLIDIGVQFDEQNKIRQLNEKVRNLEFKLGEQSDIDFSSISQYINTHNEKLSNILKAQGLNCSVDLNVSSHIDIKINFYNIDHGYRDICGFDKNEQERSKSELKHAQNLTNFKNNFETFESDKFGRSESLRYSISNTRKIAKIIQEYFGESDYFKEEIKVHTLYGKPSISECLYSITLLDSDKTFADSLKNA